MKKLITTACLLTFFLPLLAQTVVKDVKKRDPSKFYLKDGFELGDKKEVIRECAVDIKKDKDMKAMITDAESACACMFETFAEYLTSTDFLAFLPQENTDYLSMFDKLPEEARTKILSCVIPAKKDGKLDFSLAGSDNFRQSFMENCVQSATEADTTGLMASLDIEGFCGCVWDKLKERGISFEELEELSDPNSTVFNELAMGCLMALYNDILEEGDNQNDSDNSTTEAAVAPQIQGPAKEDIPLIAANKISRVKVKIGTTEKYFTIDSGAEDVFISADLERQLLLNNDIDKQHYIPDKTYHLADGNAVSCHRFMAPEIKIGNFTVKNITIAVSESKDAYLLLGKSFLNVFSSWSIDNRKQVLHLEK